MAYQPADLVNIRTCIASGVLETRLADGRSVRYQTLCEMMQAEQRIAASVEAASGTRRRRRTAIYRNGL